MPSEMVGIHPAYTRRILGICWACLGCQVTQDAPLPGRPRLEDSRAIIKEMTGASLITVRGKACCKLNGCHFSFPHLSRLQCSRLHLPSRLVALLPLGVPVSSLRLLLSASNTNSSSLSPPILLPGAATPANRTAGVISYALPLLLSLTLPCSRRGDALLRTVACSRSSSSVTRIQSSMRFLASRSSRRRFAIKYIRSSQPGTRPQRRRSRSAESSSRSSSRSL